MLLCEVIGGAGAKPGPETKKKPVPYPLKKSCNRAGFKQTLKQTLKQMLQAGSGLRLVAFKGSRRVLAAELVYGLFALIDVVEYPAPDFDEGDDALCFPGEPSA